MAPSRKSVDLDLFESSGNGSVGTNNSCQPQQPQPRQNVPGLVGQNVPSIVGPDNCTTVVVHRDSELVGVTSVSTSVTSVSSLVERVSLTPKQWKALEALVEREPGENYSQVAANAGISRQQLYRYMKMPEFMALYQERVRLDFRAARSGVAKALIRKAEEGDAASQKIYWQLSGMLTETIEVRDQPRNIETLNPEELSPEVRLELLKQVQAQMKQVGSGVTEAAAAEEESEGEIE